MGACRIFVLASLNIQENVPLAPLTTLKVGGRARYFGKVDSEGELLAAFSLAEQKRVDVFVIGGGSNVLVSDHGFDGMVVQIALKGISSRTTNSGWVEVTVQAGEDWDPFVEYCVARGLAGIECLSGIP